MATIQGKHPQLLQAVLDINAFQRKQAIIKLRETLGQNLEGKVIGILGLAFKPNTDDMREAPSLTVADYLMEAGAHVRGYDPVSMEMAAPVMKGTELCQNPYEVAEGADALVVVTDWNEFKHLDMIQIKQKMRTPVIIDGRNIYDPEKLVDMGFTYRGFGRGYNGTTKPA
jgi:UDPglucose 6-dehydrogenase